MLGLLESILFRRAVLDSPQNWAGGTEASLLPSTPHTCTASPTINTPHQSGTFVTIKPTLVHYCHLNPLVYTGTHSWCCYSTHLDQCIIVTKTHVQLAVCRSKSQYLRDEFWLERNMSFNQETAHLGRRPTPSNSQLKVLPGPGVLKEFRALNICTDSMVPATDTVSEPGGCVRGLVSVLWCAEELYSF